jgi:hypothetical protein
MDTIEALPVLADDLQAGRVGQGGQLGQRILNLPGRPALLELEADQKSFFYGCGLVGDLTPPRLRLLRRLSLAGTLLPGHLAPDLPDRHLDDPPAKVALRRIVLGILLLMFLQPCACQRLIQGKRLATMETLDVDHLDSFQQQKRPWTLQPTALINLSNTCYAITCDDLPA